MPWVGSSLKTNQVSNIYFIAEADIFDDYVLVRFKDRNYSMITVVDNFRLSNNDFRNLRRFLVSYDGSGEYQIKSLDNKTINIKFTK